MLNRSILQALVLVFYNPGLTDYLSAYNDASSHNPECVTIKNGAENNSECVAQSDGEDTVPFFYFLWIQDYLVDIENSDKPQAQ